MLSLAGMPKPVLHVYSKFLEELVAYNTIGGGVGHGQRRRCGIPQGCPLSMMVVALIMRAWVQMAKAQGATPRVLADDVLIVAKGEDMLKVFARTLNATYEYLQAMGAKIAPNKSYNFASTKSARMWLRYTWWKHIDEHISIVQLLGNDGTY